MADLHTISLLATHQEIYDTSMAPGSLSVHVRANRAGHSQTLTVLEQCLSTNTGNAYHLQGQRKLLTCSSCLTSAFMFSLDSLLTGFFDLVSLFLWRGVGYGHGSLCGAIKSMQSLFDELVVTIFVVLYKVASHIVPAAHSAAERTCCSSSC